MRGAEILGQEAVLAPLMTAAREGRLAGCYLFEGPGGVGKHAAARLVAMAAACEAEDVSARPCGGCQTCSHMERGSHPDLVELGVDPTKRTPTISVAGARDVVRAARLHRYAARHRVFIIDPADRMVPEAANAMLKTLEEPPEGTTFILVSDRSSSLLPTIISRSQRVRFRMVPTELLTKRLEQRGVADAALVALLADGRPRRADELIDGGLERHKEALERVLTVVAEGPVELFKFSEGLSKSGEGRSGWQPVVELHLLVVERLLRDAAVVAMGSDQPIANDRALVERWAEALWPSGFERVNAALDSSRARIERNVNARLVVEPLLACLATELGRARRAR